MSSSDGGKKERQKAALAAFEQRRNATRESEKVKHFKPKKQKRKEVKEAEAKKLTVPGLPDNLPKYCTLKTKTFYSLLANVGELARVWARESERMALLNPNNPAIISITQNVMKCSDVLAKVLQETVAQIQIDNLEMTKDAHMLKEQMQKQKEGESNDSRKTDSR